MVSIREWVSVRWKDWTSREASGGGGGGRVERKIPSTV